MTIEIITTGGTIDKVYFYDRSDFQVGDSEIDHILIDSNATLDHTVTPLMQKDSLNITDEDRKLIRTTIVESSNSQFIVTHGTDTMRDTALVLKSIPNKVLVLTGAMQPARFRSTDAVFNVRCAITAMQILRPGVYIAMNGRIFDPEPL